MTDNPVELSGQAPTQAAKQSEGLTPELIEEITVKVYALMLREMKIERERQRQPPKRPFSRGG